jgi:uncharacterized protein YlzI (FlbEa/FlbD family)
MKEGKKLAVQRKQENVVTSISSFICSIDPVPSTILE